MRVARWVVVCLTVDVCVVGGLYGSCIYVGVAAAPQLTCFSIFVYSLFLGVAGAARQRAPP